MANAELTFKPDHWMGAHHIDCTPEDVQIGKRVEAYFADISDEATIPKFKPLT